MVDTVYKLKDKSQKSLYDPKMEEILHWLPTSEEGIRT